MERNEKSAFFMRRCVFAFTLPLPDSAAEPPVPSAAAETAQGNL